METVLSIQRAVDYVEEHILEKLDFAEVAARAYMSSAHFQRLFSMLCGVSLGEYIRCRRLSLAAVEIQTTGTKIAELACKYGYESPESFSRAFSRFHQTTPMMARNHGTVRTFARITVKNILEGMNLMQERIQERGYTVGRVGSVYLTADMEKTASWFEHVLGWYAGVETTDAQGRPVYGCAMPFSGELVHLGVTTFNGIFLLPGETPQCLISMMAVQGIEALYAHARKMGWEQITEVTVRPWGAKQCDVTTVDGCVLRFFEPIE